MNEITVTVGTTTYTVSGVYAIGRAIDSSAGRVFVDGRELTGAALAALTDSAAFIDAVDDAVREAACEAGHD